MKYMTYYETEEIVSEKEYMNAFAKLQAENPYIQKKIDYIERYHFISELSENLHLPEYSICKKNEEELFLEKTSIQGNLFWRECEQITAEEAQKLRDGIRDWMKDDPRHLVRDFYLQMTINRLRYDFCETYEREEYVYHKSDRVVFNRDLRKIRGNYVLECMPRGCVQVKMRRAKTIPRVIQGMMQGPEFVAGVPAYA
ncbi:MAG: hypothetical protein ACOYBE_10380 [Blautia sp.]|jgi:hypothetical protein